MGSMQIQLLKMRSYWFRMDHNSVVNILIRERKYGKQLCTVWHVITEGRPTIEHLVLAAEERKM